MHPFRKSLINTQHSLNFLVALLIFSALDCERLWGAEWDYGLWTTNVSEAIEQARDKKRPLIVQMGSLVNCSHCQETWAKVLCDDGEHHWETPTQYGYICTAVNDGHPWANYARQKQLVCLELSSFAQPELFENLKNDYRPQLEKILYPAFLIFHIPENYSIPVNDRNATVIAEALDPGLVNVIDGFYYRADPPDGSGITPKQTFEDFSAIIEWYFRPGGNPYWTTIDPNLPPVSYDSKDKVQLFKPNLTTITVIAEDTYPDGDTVRIKTINSGSGGRISGVQGLSFSYLPPPQWVTDGTGGTDVVTFVVKDSFGEESNTATVTITVNAPPTIDVPDNELAVTGASIAGDWAFKLQPLEVLDPDGNREVTPAQPTFEGLQFEGSSFVGSEDDQIDGGDVGVVSNKSNKPLVYYSPNQAALDAGSARMVITVTDNDEGATESDTIILNIATTGGDGGGAPEITVAGGKTKSISANDIAVFELEITGDSERELFIQLASGTGTGKVKFLGVDLIEDLWVKAGVDNPRKIAYVPAATGDFPFTIKAKYGGSNESQVDLIVHVSSPNSPPTIDPVISHYAVESGGSLTIDMSGKIHDAEADDGSLGLAVSGSENASLDGTIIMYTAPADRSVAQTFDRFALTVTDSQGATAKKEFSVVVSPTHEEGVNSWFLVQAKKSNLINLGQLNGATAVALKAVTLPINAALSPPFKSGDDWLVEYTPATSNNTSRTENFTLEVTSGSTRESIDVVVDITVNAQPVFASPTKIEIDNGQASEKGPLTVAADTADGDAPSFSILTGAVKGTAEIVSGPKVEYTPNAPLKDNGGTDTFTVLVVDSRGGLTEVVFTVTVEEKQNQPPVLAPTVPVKVSPWQVLRRIPVAINLNVSDDFTTISELSFDPSYETETVVTGGTVSLEKTDTDAIAYFTPNESFSGGSFGVSVTDGHAGSNPSQATVNLVLDGTLADPKIVVLEPGWNFVSFPIKPSSADLENILTIAGAGAQFWEWMPGTGPFLMQAGTEIKTDKTYCIFVNDNVGGTVTLGEQ